MLPLGYSKLFERTQDNAVASRRPHTATWILRCTCGLVLVLLSSILAACAAPASPAVSDSPAVLRLDAPQDLIQQVNRSQTSGEVTVTVHQAYADRNRLLVGYTVGGLTTDGSHPPDVELRTADGRQVRAREWTSDPTGMWFSSVVVFDTPVLTTTTTVLALRLTVSPQADAQGIVAAPSIDVDFQLPVVGGQTIPVDQTQTGADLKIRLAEVVMTPTEARMRLCFSQQNDIPTLWEPTGTLTLPDGQMRTPTSTRIASDQPDACVEQFYPGASLVAGQWTLAITELRSGADGAQRQGRWVFHFTVADDAAQPSPAAP